MQKRLLFFNIFLCQGDKFTNFPIDRFFDDLISLNIKTRFVEVDKLKYKLNSVRHVEDDLNDRDIWFCKYREDKPFIGNIETDDTDPIDSDVIEPTIFSYISSSNLLIMGYNNYGPSQKILELYLNSFIDNENATENEEYNIKIIPIKDTDQLNLIRNSSYINKIDIEYRVADYDYSKLLNGDYNQKSIFTEALEDNKKVSELLGSQIGLLSLKKGRFRNPIDMEQALTLFSNIDIENEVIRDIKVEIKDPFGKMKPISLKHNGLLYKYIDVNGNRFDYLREKIRYDYYNGLNQPGFNNHALFQLKELDYRNIIQQS